MSDVTGAFLAKSRELLVSDYLAKIEKSVEPLTDADLWWRPNESSNSVANLILHLCGNVGQWMLSGVGRRAYERDRQLEFDERVPLPRQQLLVKLRTTVREADEVIAGLSPASLLERRQIQNYDVTVFDA